MDLAFHIIVVIRTHFRGDKPGRILDCLSWYIGQVPTYLHNPLARTNLEKRMRRCIAQRSAAQIEKWSTVFCAQCCYLLFRLVSIYWQSLKEMNAIIITISFLSGSHLPPYAPGL
jgi:hypothetical protein